ncbi:NAD(P)/FAD-dependent oxidoreductase [Microbulbifer thermotolerans]|uniref:NAD(P)/FAD-dependent oxidoreductase n=1 Tax=Microbulbifer thermotolerans TaxID=252514 RepID=UPI00224ABFC3|nr:NAD(P)/FAD-dependent oxidoreductase [Microbulbifer thermotolerans]MCX2781193.1 NAD(P)/FAD-dependent oxidoreductase [Microbulbifer thermotolerans]MCX2783007.1 NAD(P)/FAD-dependent oxidoreductase [Microbulbifer thermotolerans]MCX2803463.1 NAD(P)/FAD-dependent oxidoreductase [Microbulbifer thermotolerans]
MKKIVIVGGGAGGLQLATRLGRYFSFTPYLKRRRKSPAAQVTLVDKNRTHIWKPLLHQVATGALDSSLDSLNYQVHARSHGFIFQLGSLQKLDRERRVIHLAPVEDDKGQQLVPARELEYDYLVLCIGSRSNDFHIPGVHEHCVFLDCSVQAQRFHRLLLDRFLQLETHTEKKLQIAIVGGGATGVELSAELVEACRQMGNYGHIRRNAMDITLIEAGPHLLPALPPRLGKNAERELRKLEVRVLTGCTVAKATADGLITQNGDKIAATIRVWAAGVKAPDFLAQLDGLTVNRINQIKVKPDLLSVDDDNIFALGDCADCIDAVGQKVPPRAQAAQQMAGVAEYNLLAKIEGRPLKPFRYRDRGSLVSLSQHTAVGNLMGTLVKGRLTIEGRIAGLAYRSLYRMHLAAVHGWSKAMLIYLVGKANRFVKPPLKMH